MGFPATILYFFPFRKETVLAITAVWNGVDILPKLVAEHIKRKYRTRIKIFYHEYCFKMTNWKLLQYKWEKFLKRLINYSISCFILIKYWPTILV